VERGRGKRYPAELRLQISGWARREIARGSSPRAAARRLGLHPETLRAWCGDASPSSTALVPVEIVGSAAAPTPTAIRIVSPAGYRVEGLALDEVAALLKVLG